jgi:hypothetical protein
MDNLQMLEFFIQEFKNMQTESQIKFAISKEFDEEFHNETDTIKVFMLKAKIDMARQKFAEEMQYIEGKCDGYVKVMELIGIDCSQFKKQ